MDGERGSDGPWMRSNRPSKPGFNRTTMLIAWPSIEQGSSTFNNGLCSLQAIALANVLVVADSPYDGFLIEQAGRMGSMGSP